MSELSGVKFRKVIDSLPAYVAGKGDAGTAIKLSSNENPAVPSETAIAAGVKALATANRYADALGSPLVQELAAHYHLKPEQIVVGNGSIEVLACALRAVAESENNVVMPWRSFEAYPILVGITGAESRQVPLTETAEHDIPGLVDAVDEKTAAILLCSPNNPTGPSLSEEKVRYVLDNVREDILVLLDEAYIDFDDSNHVDGLDLVDEYPNLVTLRTFSKAYGLAALRCGFSISSPEVATAIRAVSTPFQVNGVAQMMAIAALAEEEQKNLQVNQIQKERGRVVKKLQELGWNLPATNANFVWFPGQPGQLIMKACKAAGITVRPFPDGVRVTIGTKVDNDAFLAAIAEIKPA